MVFMIGLIDRQMNFYGVNVQHGVDLFARSVRSSWLVVVTCSQRPRYFAAISFDIQCTSFGSEALTSLRPSSMASNPNSSFRQDSTKRSAWHHLSQCPSNSCQDLFSVRPNQIAFWWSLRSLCLHSSYQFAIITYQHDMRHSSSWRLAILTALLLSSHQSPNPSSIWLLFSNVIPYEVYRQ